MNNDNRMKFVLIKERPIFGYALFYAMGSYLAFIYDSDLFIIHIIIDVLVLGVIVQTLRLKSPRYFILFLCLFIGYSMSFNAIPSWYREPITPIEECHISGDVIKVEEYEKYSRYTLTNVTAAGDELSGNVILTNVTPKNKVEIGDRILVSAELELPAVALSDGFYNERKYNMTKNVNILPQYSRSA